MMMSRNKVLIAILVILGVIGVAFLTSNKPNNEQQLSTGENPVVQTGWQEQTVDEIGLTLSYPSDLTFRKELGDNAGNIRTVAFYIEKGDQNNPDYQLYALYLADKEGSTRDLELAKTGMDAASVKEASIDGYSGIEGVANANDPKKHYLTVVLKDGRLFSVSTYPPQPENKELTDQIIQTFNFQ